MPGGLGPRFALEAGFLIVLAAVATYARLDATEIILVMGAGWLLASIFEVLAARRERLYLGATWEQRVETGEEPAAAQEHVEEDSVPEEAAVAEAAPLAPPAPKVDDEATGEIALPKRRRWFRRGGPEPAPTVEEVEARPSARHVRLIRDRTSTDEIEQRKDAEAGS